MKKYLVIDVGGSSVKYAVVREDLAFERQGSVAAPRDDFQQFKDCLTGLYEQCEETLDGIAVSLAGTLDPKSGDIFLSGAFPFLGGKNIRDFLPAACPLPVTVENDARSAAIAELRSGALAGVQDAIAIILGSSIGGAIIHNGRIQYGRHFSAAEFSLIKVDSTDDSLHRLWRNVNGMHGLLRLVQKSLGTTESYTGIEIFEMAECGDAKVLAGIDEFCRLLAIQVYNVQAFADPEKIAVGGGISAQPLLFELLNKHLDRIFAQETEFGLAVARPQIVGCKYQNSANLIGALYAHLDAVE